MPPSHPARIRFFWLWIAACATPLVWGCGPGGGPESYVRCQAITQGKPLCDGSWPSLAHECKGAWLCDDFKSYGDYGVSIYYYARYACSAGACTCEYLLKPTGSSDDDVNGVDGTDTRRASFNATCSGAFAAARTACRFPEDLARDAPWKTSGLVRTLAGGAKAGSANGAALAATFKAPSGLAVDSAGKIFIADSGNHQVRVLYGGKVETLAGSVAGYKDGATATALLAGPVDLAVDKAGAVYVVEQDNHVVRRISAGSVATLAGTGLPGYQDGPAATATFRRPQGLDVDAQGAVWVADQDNYRLRKVLSGTVTTVAGENQSKIVDGPVAEARFLSPVDVAVTASGNVYVSDQGHVGDSRLRLVAGGVVTTAAGGGNGIIDDDGPADKAIFWDIGDLALSGARVYIAGAYSIRTLESGQVKTLTDIKGPTTGSGPFGPSGVAVDGSGKLLFTWGNAVCELAP